MKSIEPYRGSNGATIAQYIGKSVAAHVEVVRVDRRGAASYVVCLNAEHSNLRGCLLGVKSDGTEVELGRLDVAAGSLAASRFAVAAPGRGGFNVVLLDIRGADVMLRLAAPSLPALRPSHLRTALSVGTGLLVLGLAATAIGVTTLPAAAPPSIDAPLLVAPAPAPLPRAAPPHVARVATFSARREPFGDGESILASYLAVADGGELSVSDRHGRVVAHAPFTRGGTGRVAIPLGLTAQSVTVRLDVRNGSTRAATAIELPPLAALAAVAPGSGPAPGANDVPEAVVPADDRPNATGGEPFAVVGAPVAGRPLTVTIARYVAGMRLRLADEAGLLIDEVAVNPSAPTVKLRTPPSSTVRTYYLSCSYASGNGNELLVRSVRVAPA